MKTKYLIMLSEIIDKMEIKKELKSLEVNTGDEAKDNEELGKELIALIITRIYKCEKEFYSFIASFKGYLPDKRDYEYDPEEHLDYTKDQANAEISRLNKEYKTKCKEALKKAEDEDIIQIFKDLSKLDGVKSFLSLA